MYSQDFHFRPSPPKIGIEDENISIRPVARVLLNRLRPHYPFRQAVADRVVGVGLHQQRRPVKLNLCIVVLQFQRIYRITP